MRDHADAFMSGADSSSLARVRLVNFRNYEDLLIDLPVGVTVFQGENGQGKTNLLEAVYFLAFLRSFRTSRTGDLCRVGADGFHCSAKIAGALSNDSLELAATCSDRQRKLAVDGVELESRWFVNQFNCIAFVPEDMSLVKGAPVFRRRYLNILLSQLYPDYLNSLIAYNKILKNRNAVLRNPQKFGRAAVGAYDELFARHGATLILYRLRILQKINVLLGENPVFTRDDLALAFNPGLPVNRKDIIDDHEELRLRLLWVLQKGMARDLERGYTCQGAHRDDFDLVLNGGDISQLGSEGQCRAAALSLKMAAGQIVKNELGYVKPLVVIVDDVLGELDERNRVDFFSNVTGKGQVLVACTRLSAELKKLNPTVFEVEGGKVRST